MLYQNLHYHHGIFGNKLSQSDQVNLAVKLGNFKLAQICRLLRRAIHLRYEASSMELRRINNYDLERSCLPIFDNFASCVRVLAFLLHCKQNIRIYTRVDQRIHLIYAQL